MTNRTAKRIAHQIAYRFLQQALDGGGREAVAQYGGTEADQRKIDDALDALTQRHFELGDHRFSLSDDGANPPAGAPR